MTKCNRVIVCQDGRKRLLEDLAQPSQIDAIPYDPVLRERLREGCNRDEPLLAALRSSGVSAWLFDGYEDDLLTKIGDPIIGADGLDKLIRGSGADGMVFDLNYFGNFEYGMRMLRVLQSRGTLHQLSKIVIVSWFLHEREYKFPIRLEQEFNIPSERLICAYRCTIADVVGLLTA